FRDEFRPALGAGGSAVQIRAPRPISTLSKARPCLPAVSRESPGPSDPARYNLNFDHVRFALRPGGLRSKTGGGIRGDSPPRSASRVAAHGGPPHHPSAPAASGKRERGRP